jgi:hypothetical protein
MSNEAEASYGGHDKEDNITRRIREARARGMAEAIEAVEIYKNGYVAEADSERRVCDNIIACIQARIKATDTK